MKAVPVGDHYAIYAEDYYEKGRRDVLVGVVRPKAPTEVWEWAWAPLQAQGCEPQGFTTVEAALRAALRIG